jgi:hypothetical protein
MTADPELEPPCPHSADVWIAGRGCWVCPGCLCAVCSRCRRLYTAMPAAEEPEDPPWSAELAEIGEPNRYKSVDSTAGVWWTSTCGCRTTFSAEVLLPPACWLRDSANVEKYEDNDGPRASTTGIPAKCPTGDEVLATTTARVESLSTSDASGEVLMKAKDMNAVLDELQKAALYFAAVDDARYAEAFGALAKTMTIQLEATAPGYMGNSRDYAKRTIALSREMDPIDYPGGDPRIKRKLETLLFLRGMREREILALLSHDSDFRERAASLFPRLLEEARTKESTSWWSRIFQRKKREPGRS